MFNEFTLNPHPSVASGLGLSDTSPPITPLLQTKLYLPTPSARLVTRLHLAERLNQGLQNKLTLVSAPAGFGKTSLVAGWLAGVQGVKGCWLSLDERDNDPACFWRYLVAALQTADSRIGAGVQTALVHPQIPPVEALATAVLNDLTTFSLPTLLVLDDYHLMTNDTIHQSIHFLLNHLPPHSHLMLLTRADPPLPLARLRAQGQLVELRAHDLRFSLPEIETWLNTLMQLDLSQEELETLATRTEGWAAGLQMAALSLQTAVFAPELASQDTLYAKNDRSQFINTFAGDDRYVMDYLIDEVVNGQPAVIQNFLLQTSILEHLTAPLCDAVLGFATAESTASQPAPITQNSQAILEHLEQANLFLLPLDNRRQWYRYHRLFGELLRTRLYRAATAVGTLHQRAAQWYQSHGYPAEAMPHALQAADYDLAAQLLEKMYQPMVLQGEMLTLRRWLDRLPPALVKSRVRLSLAYAFASAYSSRQDQFENALSQAEAALENQTADADPLRGEIFALKAAFISIYGYAQQAQVLARQALSLLGDGDWWLKAISYQALGNACRLQGQPAAANEAYEQVQTFFHAYNAPFLALVPLARQGQVQIMQGRLHQAAATFEQVLHRAKAYGGEVLITAGESFAHLASVYYEWNELDKAHDYLKKELVLARQGQIAAALSVCYLLLARLEQAQGHSLAAAEWMREAELLAAQYDFPYLTAQTGMARAWLELQWGNVDSAVSWAESHTNQTPTAAIPETLWETADLVTAHIRLAQGRPDTAKKIALHLQTAAEKNGRFRMVLETMVLQAAIYATQGHQAQAEETLRQTIHLAEPEGYIRLFVDGGPVVAALLPHIAQHNPSNYVQRLLTAVSPLPPSQPDDSLLDALTEREQEILTRMARGDSNQQIADQLVITVGTVKGHINHILSKLGAHNRTEAVARGRERHLLKS